jgi:hypothetical protein
MAISACGASPGGGITSGGGKSRGEQSPSTAGELPGVPATMRQELDATTARGREIARYEVAAAAATDTLLASNPDKSQMGMFIAIGQGDNWTVYFGRLSADRQAFDVAYAFACVKDRCAPTAAKTGAELADFARAIDKGQGAIEPKTDRYNVNVFREPDRSITLYFTPGNTDPNVLLTGGDYKVSLTTDGETVTGSKPLHMSILKNPAKLPDGATPVGSIANNILSEQPNETDVAATLLYPLFGEHIILCNNWMFRIEKDGHIVVIAHRGQ